MTEIAITNAEPATDAAPPAADPPAAPAPTPEETAAAEATKIAEAKAVEELAAARKESREIAEAKSQAWRAKQEAKRAQAQYEEIQRQRQADLERIARIEKLEKMDAREALEWLETEKNLTGQQLGRAVVERGSPDEIEARAAEKAYKRLKSEQEAADKARQEKEQEERDRQARTQAIEHWEKEKLADETAYPVINALLSAGPAMKEMVRHQTFRIYQLAFEDKQRTGISRTDKEIDSELEKFLASEYGVITQRIRGTAEKPSAANGTSESAKSAAAAPNVTAAAANGIPSLGSELPKDFKSWSKDKQNQYFLDAVRKPSR